MFELIMTCQIITKEKICYEMLNVRAGHLEFEKNLFLAKQIKMIYLPPA